MNNIYLLCKPVFDSEWNTHIGYSEPYFASFDFEKVKERAIADTNEEIQYRSTQTTKPITLVEKLDSYKNRSFWYYIPYFNPPEHKINHTFVCSIIEIEVE